jgi:hypothetical protein
MHRHHNEHVSMSCIPRYQACNETTFPDHMPTGKWALVNTVMNLWVPWNAGNFLTSWEPVSFSRRTLLLGISKYVHQQGNFRQFILTVHDECRCDISTPTNDYSHQQWTKVQEGIGYVFEKKLDCPKKSKEVPFLTHTYFVCQYTLVSLFTLDPTCFGYFYHHQRSVHYIFSYYFL